MFEARSRLSTSSCRVNNDMQWLVLTQLEVTARVSRSADWTLPHHNTSLTPTSSFYCLLLSPSLLSHSTSTACRQTVVWPQSDINNQHSRTGL